MTDKKMRAKQKTSRQGKAPPKQTSGGRAKEKSGDKELAKSQRLLKILEECFAGKQYHPLTFQELAAKLSIHEMHLPLLREVLAELTQTKKILLKQERYSPVSSEESGMVQGVIHMNPRGFGFVEVEGLEQDIFIPRHSTKNAIEGDRVEVAVSSLVSEKGPEGKVNTILTRGRSHLAGIVTQVNGHTALVHVPLLGSDEPVELKISKQETLQVGDRVKMKVISWGTDHESTTCALTRLLGHINDPSCDVVASLEEFEIRAEFPPAVVQAAKEFGRTVTEEVIKEREDLRNVETFTIDPDTAKDYDDALSLSKDQKGIYHLAVHIADVSHYVTSASPLDDEAFARANSTYFPGMSVPMLPRELSDNLCSLKPKVSRLTVTVFMDFDAHGGLIHYRIARTAICSAKRFTYKEARAVLDGKKKSPHYNTLLLMQELCSLLKKQRYTRGSVEFAMPELVVLVNEKGEPTGTDYVEYDVTHQLVEEFMLKANETVARHLDTQGKGLPFRVHDEPSEENMRDFALLAETFGFKLPLKPTSQDIQQLFDSALQTSYGQYLATSYIRRMRLAVYSPINIGHFGLSLTHYCHFTSPIRRYVDLVAHRLLFESPYDHILLDKIATRCSERERISAKAESSVVLLKKYRLLKKFYEENSKRQYEAVITRIKPFGIFFEVLELVLEGFLHISEIGADYYMYDERTQHLRGSRRGERFATGDKFSVMLKQLDITTCESQWYRVG
jgi:ribonuclease R